MLHHIGSLLAYSSELFKGMCSTHNRVECMTTFMFSPALNTWRIRFAGQGLGPLCTWDQNMW